MQKSSVLVLLVALAVPGVVSAHPTWLDACEQAVLDYAYYRDRPDADNVAKLFTSDGTFKMAQDVFSGRDAIHQRIGAASATRGDLGGQSDEDILPPGLLDPV